MEFAVEGLMRNVRVDCCDGSDEYLGYVSCPNTCKEEHDLWMFVSVLL